MIQRKDIEKKFEAGAFPEGTSLEEKVKIVNEFRRELKAYKRQVAKESLEKEFEDKEEVITKLIRSLGRRINRATKKVDKDFQKIAKLNQEFKPENSSLEDKVEIIVKLHRELKAQKGRKDEVKVLAKLIHNLEDRMDRAATKIAQDFEKAAQQHGRKGGFTSKKAAEFESSKKSKTISKGKISEQNKQEKISTQTDKIHDLVSETERAVSEDKSFKQKEIFVQKPLVQPSVSKDPIKDKSSDKKPQLSKKQENQKKEGFLSFLKRFINKMLGKDKKSMEDMKGAAQENTSSNKVQEKNELFLSQDQNVNESLKQPVKLDDPSITSKVNTERER